MKNAFHELSNSALVNRAQQLANEERSITLQLIEYLREIDSRMAYAELGYGSLFEFTVKYLGLSEGSAHRRISAMRLIRDVPEVKHKIESGDLSVTNAAKIQVAFRAVEVKVEMTEEVKTEVIHACLNQTQNSCDQILLQQLPDLAKTLPIEKLRPVTEDQTELKLVISNDLLLKIEQLNAFVSHSNPEQKIVTLLERLVDQELKRQKEKRTMTPPKVGTQNHSTVGSSLKPVMESQKIVIGKSIPLKIQKRVWNQAGPQNGVPHCQYPGCTSTYQLQIDHRLPRALGGTNELKNLRILCRTHNLYEARRLLGDPKMNSFRLKRA